MKGGDRFLQEGGIGRKTRAKNRLAGELLGDRIERCRNGDNNLLVFETIGRIERCHRFIPLLAQVSKVER